MDPPYVPQSESGEPVRSLDARPNAHADSAFQVPEQTLLLATVVIGEVWLLDVTDLGNTQLATIILVLMGAYTAFHVVRRWRFSGVITMLFAILLGLLHRIQLAPYEGSDTIDATREALATVAIGANPYTHFFMSTRPAGSPFPYFPGELLFYGIPNAIFHSITNVDQITGIATLFLFVIAAKFSGWARAAICCMIYAVFTRAAWASVDGSNDGALAFLLASALLLWAWYERSEHTALPQKLRTVLGYSSAVMLAWALMFKLLAWPFAFTLAVYSFRKNKQVRYYWQTVIAISLISIAPWALWAPLAFFTSIFGGVTFHPNIWGFDIWCALQSTGLHLGFFRPVIPFFTLCITTSVSMATLRFRARSLGESAFAGAMILFCGLILARWSTAPYYSFMFTMFLVAMLLTTASPLPRSENSALSNV